MGAGPTRPVSPGGGRYRVLFVVGQLTMGGLENQVYLLASGLRGGALDVGVVAMEPGGVFARALTSAGIPVVALDRRGHLDWRRLWALWRVFRTERPDLVYSFNFAGNTYARLAGLLAGVPVLVTGERGGIITRSMAIVERLLVRFTDCIVCNAESIRRDLIDRIGLPEHKILTIPNGIRVTPPPAPGVRPAIRRSLGVADDEILVGTIARLSPDKNLELLIRAASLCRKGPVPMRFVVVGGGPLETALHASIADAGLGERFRLLGEREDARGMLPAFDIFVLCSRIEGLPNGVMEAMAAGLPCVCTDVGGCRELIDDGVSGCLVPPGDGSALAARLRELANDPGRRAAFGRNAARKIAAEYSVERLVSRVEKLFLELLRASASRGRRRPANVAEAG